MNTIVLYCLNMTCIVYCVSDTKIRFNIIFSKRHGKFNIYYIFIYILSILTFFKVPISIHLKVYYGFKLTNPPKKKIIIISSR